MLALRPEKEKHMKVTYDAEQKWLTIIAGNDDEQSNFEVLSGLMKHGDICEISQSQHLTRDDAFVVVLGGAVERRQNVPLQCYLDPKIVGYQESIVALNVFWTALENIEWVFSDLVYLWPDEVKGDGWNTLVFAHK
jgi:hypothetical protein